MAMSPNIFDILIILLSSVTSDESATFTIATWLTIPSTSNDIAGYDNNSQIVWLMNDEQFTSFDINEPNASNAFMLHYRDEWNDWDGVWAQSYTQIENIVYIIHPDWRWPFEKPTYFSIFDLSSTQYTSQWNNIMIPTLSHGATACLTHINNNYLIVSGGQTYTEKNDDPMYDTYDLYEQYLKSTQIYNISSNQWIFSVPNMTVSRSGHTCIVVNEYLYEIGGEFGQHNATNSVEKIYINDLGNIGQQNWITIDDMLSAPKYALRSVVYNDYIFVIGGYVGWQLTTQIDVIDTGNNDKVMLYGYTLGITAQKIMPIVVNNRIYVFGWNLLHPQYNDINEPNNFNATTVSTTPTISTISTVYFNDQNGAVKCSNAICVVTLITLIWAVEMK